MTDLVRTNGWVTSHVEVKGYGWIRKIKDMTDLLNRTKFLELGGQSRATPDMMTMIMRMTTTTMMIMTMLIIITSFFPQG